MFAEMMTTYEAEHPNLELNVGTRRLLTIEFFRQLPLDDQAKYRAIATERLQTIHALSALSGDEKTE